VVDYLNMTAPCGLDCFNCPLYLANENENIRKAVAARLGLDPEQAVCGGCRNENGTIACIGMTGPCNVYRCIERKGIDFCFDCRDFPCDHLHPYADKAGERPHNTKVFNLCLIKKMGLDRWAPEKAKSVNATYYKGSFKL
jgi:hypothetical protein